MEDNVYDQTRRNGKPFIAIAIGAIMLWSGWLAGENPSIQASADNLPWGLKVVEGKWSATDGTVSASPANTWTCALADSTSDRSQFAEAEFTVVESGVVLMGSTGYQVTLGPDLPGENDPCADFALFLRRDDSPPLPVFYRIQISAHPQAGEIAVWRTNGGFLAVKSFAFKEGTTYKIRALSCGPSIEILIDGQPVLSCMDRRPLAGGKTGIGTLRGRTTVKSFVTGGLKSDPPPYVHTLNFKLREWNPAHPGKWIFDGDEPVLNFNLKPKSLDLTCLKLRPASMPAIAFCPLSWTQWTGDDTELSVPEKVEFLEEGRQWRLSATFVPKSGAGANAEISMAITYDEQSQSYIYNFISSMKVSGSAALPYRHPLEWWDPWPIGAGGTALDHDRVPRQRWSHVMWEQPDGKPPRKLALNHDYLAIGASPSNAKLGNNKLYSEHLSNLSIRENGINAFVLYDDVNIVTILKRSQGDATPYNELCAWGFDMHFRLRNEEWRKTGIPAGTELKVEWSVTHQDSAKLAPILESAKNLFDFIEPSNIPVVEWPSSGFEKTVSMQEHHNSATWTGGTLAVGGADGSKNCIILSGGEKLGIEPFGKGGYFPEKLFTWGVWKIRFQARTDGDTALLRVNCVATNPRNSKNIKELTIPKADGWRTFEMDSDVLSGLISGFFLMENIGTAPVRIDNVSFIAPTTPTIPGVWAMELEKIAPQFLVMDDDAGNRMAAKLTTENSDLKTCIYGPYDITLPPGDYVARVRLKVSDNTVKENLVGWDVCQSEGAKSYVPANGDWKGTDFTAPNRYEEKSFTFHREAAGRLSFRFYRRAMTGDIFLDRITLEKQNLK